MRHSAEVVKAQELEMGEIILNFPGRPKNLIKGLFHMPLCLATENQREGSMSRDVASITEEGVGARSQEYGPVETGEGED